MKDQDLMTHSEHQVENNLEGKENNNNLESKNIEPNVSIDDNTVDATSISNENSGESPSNLVVDDSQEIQTKTKDYSLFSKHELVSELSSVLEQEYSVVLKNTVETLRSLFYTKHKEEQAICLKKYLDNGGVEEDFDLTPSGDELNMKSLLKTFREKKYSFTQKLESEKESNLKEKYAIIEEIKELTMSDESQLNPFTRFKELQKQWFEIGMVPQSSLKHMWDSYHHNVEKFYDFIKINQELKELDFKRNLDSKTSLCENAEALLESESIVKAFNLLQNYHDQWREIGPVSRDLKEALWLRFKTATTTINKKHQDYYESIKANQRENLAKKTILCSQVEEISSRDFDEHKLWNKASKEIIDLQTQWRNIGFAPKKENEQIYLRFRLACDGFFASKRDFYIQLKNVLNINLDQKIELCVKAETLKESTEWKRTTDEFIAIQKQWKEIGAVPRKDSDEVWTRFRSACDSFFNSKSAHYNSLESGYAENLLLKKELITKLSSFSLTNDFSADLNQLKQFQTEWNNIGHVPFSDKDKLIHEFRVLINSFYDNLKTDVASKELERFKSKVDSYRTTSKSDDKILNEKSKLQAKLKQLESDIIISENNLGFFSNSKSAEGLMADFRKKIEKSRQNAEFIKEKIRVIDQLS